MSNIMNSAIFTPIPTFRIYTKEGRKVETLLSCFTKEIDITEEDYLHLRSFNLQGRDYKVIWDKTLTERSRLAVKDTDILSCVASFQAHTYGCYCVIKLRRKI